MLRDTVLSFERAVDRICIRSGLFTVRNWQYCCMLSGALSGLLLLLAMISLGGFPPIPPSWGAEQVYEHYQNHQTGTAAAGSMMIIAGGLWIPWGAVISQQLRLIPNIDPTICNLQLAACAATVFSLMMPGFFFSLIAFRDYGLQVTLFISDISWLIIIGQWPTFWIQGWTIAWAIFSDRSANPMFPKMLGAWNLVSPIIFSFAAGIHTRHHGVWAWNGALAFWCPVAFFGLQTGMEIFCMLRNIKAKHIDGERIIYQVE
ncbi:uncharacterized protein N7483_010285 [Penicillium malachiteum]|uniref:uncharacterized protein n=1 Tax=Penicillium malachiteum TaxID=1324776 RepID=UPI0025497F03|nr:uncharacterized protein N7483_010285 [Penicillium malachiteum]KAJ5713104.1 hypothetical protein N7483_010285 [Penicillium malachiteum]